MITKPPSKILTPRFPVSDLSSSGSGGCGKIESTGYALLEKQIRM